MSFSIRSDANSYVHLDPAFECVKAKDRTLIDKIAVETLLSQTEQERSLPSLNNRVYRFSLIDVSKPKLKGFFGVIRAFFDMLVRLFGGEGLHKETLRERVKEFVARHRGSCALTLALMKPEDICAELKEIVKNNQDGIQQEQEVNDLVEVIFDELQKPFREANYSLNDLYNMKSIDDVFCYMASKHRKNPTPDERMDNHLDLTNIFLREDSNEDFDQFVGIIIQSGLPTIVRLDLLSQLNLLNKDSSFQVIVQSAFENYKTEAEVMRALELHMGPPSISTLKARMETIIRMIGGEEDLDIENLSCERMYLNESDLREGGRLNENLFIRFLVESWQGSPLGDKDLLTAFNEAAYDVRFISLGALAYYDNLSQDPLLSAVTKDLLRFQLFASFARVPGLEIDSMGESPKVMAVFDQGGLQQHIKAITPPEKDQSLEKYLESDITKLNACSPSDKISQKAKVLLKAYVHLLNTTEDPMNSFSANARRLSSLRELSENI